MEEMKALSYLGPGNIKWHTIAKPQVTASTDVVGKVVATTICGTDLHIWKGDVPESTAVAEQKAGAGLVLGHEAIIEVESVGSGVQKFKKGDVCIVSCITACGTCYYCKRNLQSHCNGNEGSSGWIFGHEIDGTQAEYVRVPFADTSLYKVPEGVSYDKLLMLCDAIPTSYEIGILAGGVKKGDSIAIVGLGPVGLSALMSAKTIGPSQIIAIDMDDKRLELAKQIGATHTFNPSKVSVQDLTSSIMSITTGLEAGREPGVDVAIECVGVPITFEMCEGFITPGGSIANVGVHGKSVELKLQDLWIQNCKITTGLVSAFSTKELLPKVVSGELDPSPIITHHFKFAEFEHAYDVFKNAATTNAMKIILTP